MGVFNQYWEDKKFLNKLKQFDYVHKFWQAFTSLSKLGSYFSKFSFYIEIWISAKFLFNNKMLK